ncbi:uncharacterized protein BDR25DRAFT_375244 [Lindgomyces ingoldianus]|uniref:Uncharacterized protein n=1 Tax=Lindgomyces ingoldianus TaxID=673940 RepID=A0ACB6RAT3_9PLEO|nr:uncharacterized protein BDR25DRAFT_375244 [Lindgomyces ingoldianus]KAF2476349.1 hypothetical protein BDR25DRAFT_375244 [Lindgomyces ingoldianus]
MPSTDDSYAMILCNHLATLSTLAGRVKDTFTGQFVRCPKLLLGFLQCPSHPLTIKYVHCRNNLNVLIPLDYFPGSTLLFALAQKKWTKHAHATNSSNSSNIPPRSHFIALTRIQFWTSIPIGLAKSCVPSYDQVFIAGRVARENKGASSNPTSVECPWSIEGEYGTWKYDDGRSRVFVGVEGVRLRIVFGNACCIVDS